MTSVVPIRIRTGCAFRRWGESLGDRLRSKGSLPVVGRGSLGLGCGGCNCGA